VLPRQGEDLALALLSRHPIVQDHSQENVKLHQQKRSKMLRGILDVTVRLDDGRLFRIIGAHLKSRVSDNAGAATALRKQEAYTLAQHIQHIARSQNGMPLLVFGDWNDSPSDAAPQILLQGLSKDSALRRLTPKDSRGEEWTLYFKRGKEYCIYDQIFVNPTLRERMRGQGGIVDIPAAAKASDHRALWCDLR
jgi:endonuclease/exonuclease/phosphatase family metal-dependent hydrolase